MRRAKATDKNILECVIHPDTKIIGYEAFKDCSSLMSIRIPGGVVSIGSCAFDACENLSSVYYNGTEDDWAKIKIASNNSYLERAMVVYNYLV